jgi:fructose 1,6-bisphosphate aldolase/phosphatase
MKGWSCSTLSIIKVDMGGFVGHSSMHPEMLEVARRAVDGVLGELLIDAQVACCGDDLHLIMTHERGVDAEPVDAFAWDVFQQTTALAKRLGLYGAGQDLLSDAFSGNLRGMAWNLPVYKMFADPFNTAGLVIDPKMHAGFAFEVHDLFENRRTLFDCPGELYDLLLYIGAPSRYVVEQVSSKTLGEPAAVTSTQRLALMAGRYVGKDDPVLIVRSQSGLPAVGEILEPFAFPHTVAGCMRGSHHAPLMPVAVEQAHPSRFDGPPRVVGLGF